MKGSLDQETRMVLQGQASVLLRYDPVGSDAYTGHGPLQSILPEEDTACKNPLSVPE